MFYQSDIDKALRFGDVVRGFILTNAILERPSWEEQVGHYRVDISSPALAVVMTPCCSIEDKTLVLTPLIQVRPAFFDNPYLAEDLTRVNRMMSMEQSVPPHAWQKMTEEERQKRRTVGSTWAFPDLFVYEKDGSLPEYTLHRKQPPNIVTNWYMVDFRNLYKVHCDRVNSAKDSPFESKLLQLCVESREALRVKLARYYARIPDEDRQLLEA